MKEEMRRYYATRQRFTPEGGREYENQGGGTYRCLMRGGRIPEHAAVMMNTSSSWTFIAHDCGIYEDGRIDWDYSTGGFFVKEVQG